MAAEHQYTKDSFLVKLWKRFISGPGGPAPIQASPETSNKPKPREAPKSDTQKPETTKPQLLKSPAPLPPAATHAKMPSQDNQNQPPTHVAQVEMEKIEDNKELAPKRGNENKTWVQDQHDPEAPKAARRKKGSAKHSINEAGNSNTVIQKEEKQQPQEQSPTQQQTADELRNETNSSKSIIQTEEKQPPQEKSPTQLPQEQSPTQQLTADELSNETSRSNNITQTEGSQKPQEQSPTQQPTADELSNETNRSSNINQKKGKQQPQEPSPTLQPQEELLTQLPPDELIERFKNLRLHDQNNKNMTEKRASIEETTNKNRSLLNTNESESSSFDHSKESSEMSSDPSENQEAVQNLVSNSLNIQRVQQKLESGNHFFSSPNQIHQNLENSYKTDNTKLQSSKDNPEIKSNIIKQTEGLGLSTSSSYQDYNAPSITAAEDKFVLQPTTELIYQAIGSQDEKQNIEKSDMKIAAPQSKEIPYNILDQNLEVPVQEITKTGSITEATPSNQEKLVLSDKDKFIQTTIKKIGSIEEEIAEQETEIDNFLGTSTDDRDYIYMDELMMRHLIKLDNIETGNNQEVRQKRKKGIQFIQKMLKKLDAKLKDNQRKASETVPQNSEDDKKVDDTPVNENVKNETGEE